MVSCKRWEAPLAAAITLGMVVVGMISGTALPASADQGTTSTNLALGKTYTIRATWPDPLFTKQQDSYPDTGNRELTDGKKASSWYADAGWQIFTRQGARRIDVDLGKPSTVTGVMGRFLQYRSVGVFVPRWVRFSLSLDGKEWVPVAQVATQVGPWYASPKPEEFRVDGLRYAARYVRLEFPVDILVMADEIEVYGQDTVTADAQALSDVAVATRERFPQEMVLIGNDTPVEQRPGYMPAGSPAAGGAGHMVLLPYGYPPDPNNGEWTANDYLPYVAYLSEEGQPQDWMFDTVLLSPQSATPSQHVLSSNDPKKMADKKDWEWYIDETFRAGYQLDALDQAVAQAKQVLNQPDYKVKVILSLINAPAGQRNFGDLDGDGQPESFDFRQVGREAALANRLAAEKWLMDEFLTRWQQKGYKNLELIGFYWHPEGISFSDSPDDDEFVRQVAGLVHQHGLKFYWIPYFGSAGSYDWKNYGFDVAMLQPNYMFSDSTEERVRICAEIAQALGMGVEMEKHWNEGISEVRKWLDYLNGGVKYGYIQAVTGYYQGFKDFGRAAASDPGSRRLYYDYVYQFIHGTYQTVNLNF
ncbi:MAG: DUF4855 domain-containing protein [Limnochordaceae bacterium]|nr:DUF4855 domain-containing protein [Limnochordaceae bacterium]